MTIAPDFEDAVLELASAANPTYEQKLILLAGWLVYFDYADIEPDKQLAEFEGIMKARAAVGQISLVAPKASVSW